MTDEELEAVAERMLVPSLRSALGGMTEAVARAVQAERAAVVAWLREMTTTGTPLTRVYLDQVLESLAERIERGEHRREEEK